MYQRKEHKQKSFCQSKYDMTLVFLYQYCMLIKRNLATNNLTVFLPETYSEFLEGPALLKWTPNLKTLASLLLQLRLAFRQVV